MRIQYVSDLHVDHADYSGPIERSSQGLGPLDPATLVGDVLVVAGDITDGQWEATAKYLSWLGSGGTPVVFVLGNHEHFNSIFPDEAAGVLKAAVREFPNVHVLDKESVDIGGVRFFGATLWTKFSKAKYGEAAENSMPEYAAMYTPSGDMVTWQAVAKEHTRAVNWLRAELHKPFLGQKVVVTHHAPSYRSISPQFIGSLLNPAFCSNLDDFILTTRPDVWIHGHTHDSQQYTIGDTRIVCNPWGYADEELNPRFDPQKIVEI